MNWRYALHVAKRLSQTGDTLVEVLVCISIVSLILAGAYATTNRSATAVRNSQEHSEALKLIESQLEQIRSNAVSKTPTVFTSPAPFCMVDAAVVTPATAGQCIQDSAGQPTTIDPAYKLSISRSSSLGGSLFVISAQWNSVSISSTTAQESLSYRMYP